MRSPATHEHQHDHDHDHPNPHPHPHEGGHGHESHDQDHPHEGHDHPHGAHGHDHGDGHDHDHGHGLWARIKHTLIPHAHDSVDAIQTAEESAQDGIRTAWIGLAGMMATAVLQMVIVALSGSIALLADTIHNLGHAATTIPLIIAFRLGRKAATKKFPYGYRRAEDLAGLFISLVIVASIVLIVWESIDALINPRPLTNLWWVFAAGIVGFLGNEAVAVYRIRTGKRIGSAALIAEGQHARADGFTSIAVVAGVIGVWFGFDRADAIVGLLIAVAITGILVNSLVIIVRRLMDGVEPATIDTMHETIAQVPGVTSVGLVRARWVGHRMEGDAEIGIDSATDTLGAHQVAEEVQHALMHAVANLDRVTVHVNPTIDGQVPDDLHELSGHHASPEARAAYRAKLAAQGAA